MILQNVNIKIGDEKNSGMTTLESTRFNKTFVETKTVAGKLK